MKRALLLAAVDPSLGGVLITGERGTAKSTAARGLARLWPRSGRFVTLPLGATEDQVVGSLDVEGTLQEGRLKPRPGLLARADEGVLYIDEVNLLDGHLAVLILDAAASGWVRVEREGLGFTYPTRFVLVGTMNPEEGQISPQLGDRFGLAVSVRAELAAEMRQELVRRRLAFEADPEGFLRAWAPQEEALGQRIIKARARLPEVEVGSAALNLAGRLAAQVRTAGQRGELSLIKAARAWAAWQGQPRVGPDDLRPAAPLALNHRLRPPPCAPSRPQGRPAFSDPPRPPLPRPPEPGAEPLQTPPRPAGQAKESPVWGWERVYPFNEPFALISPDQDKTGGWLRRSGRRLKRQSRDGSGRYLRASAERLGRPVALDATLRAAAPHQNERAKGALSLVVIEADIREKVKVRSHGRLVIFLVDASGSMGAHLRMQEAKTAVLSLLAEAYQKRDRVGLVAFRGSGAEILLPPTNSIELAKRCLEELPTGGKTPLGQGLATAWRMLEQQLRRDPELKPLLVVLSDGKPNVPLKPGADPWTELLELAGRLRRPGLSWLVVDSDWGHYLSFGLCRQLAARLGGRYVKLEQLRSEGLVRLVRERSSKRAK